MPWQPTAPPSTEHNLVFPYMVVKTRVGNILEIIKFWKKLNCIVKSGKPMDEALRMLDRDEITKEEMAWALSTLAVLPIAMLDNLKRTNKLS